MTWPLKPPSGPRARALPPAPTPRWRESRATTLEQVTGPQVRVRRVSASLMPMRQWDNLSCLRRAETRTLGDFDFRIRLRKAEITADGGIELVEQHSGLLTHHGVARASLGRVRGIEVRGLVGEGL